jgi:hypothetical protein
VFAASQRNYSARAYFVDRRTTGVLKTVTARPPDVCVPLPAVPGASASSPAYLIVDVLGVTGSQQRAPSRVHLYHLGGERYRVAGLERPDDEDPPD